MHTPDSLRLKDAEAITGSMLQTGFIAQEVEKTSQELGFDFSGVDKPKSKDDYYGLRYSEFVVPIVKAIQEQQKVIDNLTANSTTAAKQDSINQIAAVSQNATLDSIVEVQGAKIVELQNMILACCIRSQSTENNNNSIGSFAINVNLKDGQSIILDQNVPNPFAEQTTINYFLPDNVLKAQMLFYNAQGKLIQSVDLKEKGKGSLNVFASDLSNGIYTYTLVVDGKIIETKKMVKQQ